MDFEWDKPGFVLRPQTEEQWHEFIKMLGGQRPAPLEAVVDVVRGLAEDDVSVVVETRYVDLDYRSEFSAFWSLRFEPSEPFVQRVHFFAGAITEEQLPVLGPDLPYLGYMVLRPNAMGRLGRTMIAPPKALVEKAALTLVTDRVSVFGTRFEIEAVPFCQQDGDYVRCAHAAAWICHYVAHRRDMVGRQPSAQFVELSPTELSVERPLPSKGLNAMQLQAIFGKLGQPALFYAASRLPSVAGIDPEPSSRWPSSDLTPRGLWDQRIISIACRYLNSGFPLLIGAGHHAFVLVGWFKDGEHVRFVACDDQQGPYEVIESPFTDHRAPWESLMIPLPPRAWMCAETAENDACATLVLGAERPEDLPEYSPIGTMFVEREVSIRTTLMSAADYKANLSEQERPSDVLSKLRLAHMPHWLWVVEAQHREARDAEKACVVAEFVYDSTSSDLEPAKVAFSVPGYTQMFVDPDDVPVIAGDGAPWRSHLELDIAHRRAVPSS